MARFHIVDVDQVELGRAGYQIHATVGAEHISAIKQAATHAILWDHQPEFADILTRCMKPRLQPMEEASC